YCPTDAAATVISYDPATRTSVTLLDKGYAEWEADSTGTRVLVQDLDRNLWVMSPVGANRINVATDVRRAHFTADGMSVIYRTGAGGLYRVPAGGGVATTLQAQGVAGLNAISPDDQHVLF